MTQGPVMYQGPVLHGLVNEPGLLCQAGQPQNHSWVTWGKTSLAAHTVRIYFLYVHTPNYNQLCFAHHMYIYISYIYIYLIYIYIETPHIFILISLKFGSGTPPVALPVQPRRQGKAAHDTGGVQMVHLLDILGTAGRDGGWSTARQ